MALLFRRYLFSSTRCAVLCTFTAPSHGRVISPYNIMKAGNIAAMPAQWTDEELQGLEADFPNMLGVYDSTPSKYNPRPGTRKHNLDFAIASFAISSTLQSCSACWRCKDDNRCAVNTIRLVYRYWQDWLPACSTQQLSLLLGG